MKALKRVTAPSLKSETPSSRDFLWADKVRSCYSSSQGKEQQVAFGASSQQAVKNQSSPPLSFKEMNSANSLSEPEQISSLVESLEENVSENLGRGPMKLCPDFSWEL